MSFILSLYKYFYLTWTLIVILGLSIGSLYFLNNTSDPQNYEKPKEFDEMTVQEINKTNRINEVLSGMNLDQKIGQIFLAKVPEVNQIEDIQNYNLGGFVIFDQDVKDENSETFKQKVATWQANAGIPMIIASDEEGGIVTRVSKIVPEGFPSISQIYSAGGMQLISSETDRKDAILKSLGINVNLGPVADVAVNPSSYMYSRTLMLPAETPLVDAANTTAEYVRIVVTQSNLQQIGSTLKHFPGYGENGDSHNNLIVDKEDLNTIQSVDLIPFEAGIQAGAGGVLVSHNIYEAIDPTQPASLSPAVHELLRRDLNFNGVIMTDDFDMKGLTSFTDKNQAAVITINAGTDMIISSTYQDQIQLVRDAVNNGTISQERLRDAVTHVLSWKYDLGLI